MSGPHESFWNKSRQTCQPPFIFYFLTFFSLLNFYQSIVDLQCCFSFKCTAMWISSTYTYIHSFSFLDAFPICCCSVTKSCLTPCDPIECSTPGFPVLHYLPELAQTHIHWVGNAIQPSHPLSSPSPPALNLSQHQGLFQWVGSSHQVAKVSELQL